MALAQLENIDMSISTGDGFSTVTNIRLVQPEKASSLMDVTLLGMVMEVRPVQPEKASSPMNVTLLGMVMEVRPVQPWKA